MYSSVQWIFIKFLLYVLVAVTVISPFKNWNDGRDFLFRVNSSSSLPSSCCLHWGFECSSWKSSLLPETLLLCLPSPVPPQSSGPMRTSPWRSRPAFYRDQCTAGATVPMPLPRDRVATCQMYHFIVIHCLHLCVCVLPISNVGAKIICWLTFYLETNVAPSGSLELNLLHHCIKNNTFLLFFHFLFCHHFDTMIPTYKGQTSSNIRYWLGIKS